MKPFLTGLLLLIGLGSLAVAQQQPGPTNLDFETGPVGGPPAGWFLNAALPAGVTVRLSADDVRHGKQALVVTREPAAASAPTTNLGQRFNAVPFRGKRVRFRMAVRLDTATSRAQMWLRMDRAVLKGAQPVAAAFLDNMDDRPITSREWAHYDIVGDVPADAAEIAMGVLMLGTARRGLTMDYSKRWARPSGWSQKHRGRSRGAV